jgi:hypothetical protein
LARIATAASAFLLLASSARAENLAQGDELITKVAGEVR